MVETEYLLMDLQPKSLLVNAQQSKNFSSATWDQWEKKVRSLAYQDDGFCGSLSTLSDWNFQ